MALQSATLRLLSGEAVTIKHVHNGAELHCRAADQMGVSMTDLILLCGDSELDYSTKIRDLDHGQEIVAVVRQNSDVELLPEDSQLQKVCPRLVALPSPLSQETLKALDNNTRLRMSAHIAIYCYRLVVMDVDVLEHCCTRVTCPWMRAGRTTYQWAQNGGKPVKLSAPDYISTLLAYAQRVLTNRELIPHDDTQFPEHAIDSIKDVVKKLFRVYAHIFRHHFEEVSSRGRAHTMIRSLTGFIAHSHDFELLEEDSMEPMHRPIKKWMPNRKWSF